MAPNTSNPSRQGRRRAVFILLLLLVVLGFFAGRNAGHWLVREDALGPADVIVVLSGGLPYRALGAADIYKSGYAPEVWVSYPVGPQQELSRLGIHFVGEEEYDRDIRGPNHQYRTGSGRNRPGDEGPREAHRDHRRLTGTHAPGAGTLECAGGPGAQSNRSRGAYRPVRRRPLVAQYAGQPGGHTRIPGPDECVVRASGPPPAVDDEYGKPHNRSQARSKSSCNLRSDLKKQKSILGGAAIESFSHRSRLCGSGHGRMPGGPGARSGLHG